MGKRALRNILTMNMLMKLMLMRLTMLMTI